MCATNLFVLATPRRFAWHHNPFPKTVMEGGLFGGTCMAANLLHMEEIAFPCRMHFPMLLLMTLSMPYHLLSLPPAFCRSRAETASRHQGRDQALILPFLYLFLILHFLLCLISMKMYLCHLKSACEREHW